MKHWLIQTYPEGKVRTGPAVVRFLSSLPKVRDALEVDTNTEQGKRKDIASFGLVLAHCQNKPRYGKHRARDENDQIQIHGPLPPGLLGFPAWIATCGFSCGVSFARF